MNRLLGLALILTLVVGATLAASTPALASSATPGEPAPATAPLPATGSAPTPQQPVVVVNSGPSMEQLKQETPSLFQHVLGSFLGNLASGLKGALDTAQSFNFLTRTPPELSYRHPDVTRLWNAVRAIADAALALVAMAGGYNVLLRRHLGVTYAGALELLPRLVVGALLVNTSLWWTSLAIDANNALCAAMGVAGFPGWGRLAGEALLGGAAAVAAVVWTPAELVLVVALLLYLALCLVLVLQMLMRLVLVDVLVILAPLGLLCWILPQSQRWARLWSGTFLAAVLTQFVQVTALVLAGDLLAAIGAGAGAAGTVLGPFLGIATLLLVLKLPGFVGRQVSDGWSAVRAIAIGAAARSVSPAAAAALTGARAAGRGGRP